MLDDLLPLILTLFGIVLILYLSYIFSRFVSARSAGINSAKYMEIVDRMPVGQDRYLLIVALQGKHFLIGATGQSIQILKELDQTVTLEPIGRPGASPFDLSSFKGTLQSIMSKKKKSGE